MPIQLGERFGLQRLPEDKRYSVFENQERTMYGKKIKFDPENSEHQRIRRDNMANVYIASYQESKKLGFSDEKAKFTATMLTAMFAHESSYGLKETGINNVFGRKATSNEIKAGKGYRVNTHEIIDNQRVDSREPFLNFDSFQDSIRNQIQYINDDYPGALDEKTTHGFVKKLYSPKIGGVYATDLLSENYQKQSGYKMIEQDEHKNQYTTKLNNYIGHGWTNYNTIRPDMIIRKIGNREMWVLSGPYRRNGRMTQRQGFTGPPSTDSSMNMMDMDYVNDVINGKINQEEIQRKSFEIDAKNGFLSEYTEAALGNDSAISKSITKEQMLKSYASNEYYGGIYGSEITDGLYDINIQAGLESDTDGFSGSASTIMDDKGKTLTDVDYNLRYKTDNLDINVGKQRNKNKRSITFHNNGFEFTAEQLDQQNKQTLKYKKGGFKGQVTRDQDDNIGVGFEYRGKFKWMMAGLM